MHGRDSWQQPDTQNLHGTSGNVFEDPRAPDEPTAARFGNARSLTVTHCERVSLNTGRSVAKGDHLERNTQNFAIPTPGSFQHGILPLMLEELIRNIVWFNNRGITPECIP